MLLPSTGGPLLEGETSLAVNDQQVIGHTQMYCKYAILPPRCLPNVLIVTALKACGDLMGLVHLSFCFSSLESWQAQMVIVTTPFWPSLESHLLPMQIVSLLELVLRKHKEVPVARECVLMAMMKLTARLPSQVVRLQAIIAKHTTTNMLEVQSRCVTTSMHDCVWMFLCGSINGIHNCHVRVHVFTMWCTSVASMQHTRSWPGSKMRACVRTIQRSTAFD